MEKIQHPVIFFTIDLSHDRSTHSGRLIDTTFGIIVSLWTNSSLVGIVVYGYAEQENGSEILRKSDLCITAD